MEPFKIGPGGGTIFELIHVTEEPVSGPEVANKAFLYYLKNVGFRVKLYGSDGEPLTEANISVILEKQAADPTPLVDKGQLYAKEDAGEVELFYIKASGDVVQITPLQPPAGSNEWFGDGSDGAATLDGAAAVTWASRVGSVYTMTRDCYCTTLVVDSGVTLNTAGFKVHAKTSLTNNGRVEVTPIPGNDAVADIGGGPQITTVGSVGSTPTSGSAGASGGTGAGANGTAGNGTSNCPNNTGSGTGGDGGSGDPGGLTPGGTGGLGGTNTAPSAANGGAKAIRNIIAAYLGATKTAGGTSWASIGVGAGGAGGAAGAGDGANKGGGGGGGGVCGGYLLVAAKLIIVGATGIFSCKGGDGGDGGTTLAGDCGGGGPGSAGQGGIMILIYSTLTDNTGGAYYTIAPGSPGAVGAPSGVGSPGTTASASSSGIKVELQV